LKKFSLAAMLLSLASCTGDTPSAVAAKPDSTSGMGQVLTVYNWPDYVAPDTIAHFEKKYDVHVHYEVFTGNEVLDQKLSEDGLSGAARKRGHGCISCAGVVGLSGAAGLAEGGGEGMLKLSPAQPLSHWGRSLRDKGLGSNSGQCEIFCENGLPKPK